MTRSRVPIIGMTGSSGSGKGTVGRILETFGGAVLDADEFSRAATAVGGLAYGEVAEAFGSAVLLENGEIDRSALGAVVFADPAKRLLLEGIVHKHVARAMETETGILAQREPPPRFIVWDAPLLCEAGMEKACDAVWVVTAPYDTRLARVIRRDGITEERARARFAVQTPQDVLAAKADAVIANDSDFEDLERKVRETLLLLLQS